MQSAELQPIPTNEKIERAVGPTALRFSRARLSARGCATQRVAQNEARKRRASEQARVGCDREMGGPPLCSRSFRAAVAALNDACNNPNGSSFNRDSPERMLAAMAPCQTRKSLFTAGLLAAGAGVPPTASMTLGCAARLTPLVPKPRL